MIQPKKKRGDGVVMPAPTEMLTVEIVFRVCPQQSRLGLDDLVLICRRALTFIGSDLALGIWNRGEESSFCNARDRLIEGGYNVTKLNQALAHFQRQWASTQAKRAGKGN